MSLPFYQQALRRILPAFAFSVLVFNMAVASESRDADPLWRPDDNRFSVVPLTQPNDLAEPMVFEIADDGRAFVIERRGMIKVFDPAVGIVQSVGSLEVNTEGNKEQGLVGMALDPDFLENGWMYLYYFRPDEAKAVISRWEVRKNVLVANSEKVLIEFDAQREICCHTGGGMAWDADRNLYITIGNNRGNNMTSHTDERLGKSAWDDQGGSANTNSLEGKILRIHPEPDGSYTIPAGNLFPVGTPNTRPEIYTMGHRNAWRVSVDSLTGYIYWGEVGPDVREPTDDFPLSYDEFNQAKGPGFFGWPYFVGEEAYPVYDYAAEKPGSLKDRNNVTNLSPNNTGMKELPPLADSFVYYPYGVSDLFPALGTGGRSATGGPIFRQIDFSNPVRPWPAYFEGKWIATELSRRLIVLISMNEDGSYQSMERFLPDYRPVEPIDMKFGPDGDLYVLEYGGRWFQGSPEATLSRIQYQAGNRAPIAMASADKVGGIPPFQVKLSSVGSEDYDGDELRYEWGVTEYGGTTMTLNDPNPEVSLEGLGAYSIKLTVTDPAGESSTDKVVVVSGNQPPEVGIEVEGNSSFYFAGTPIRYSVSVEDLEDGSLKRGGIGAEDVVLSIEQVAADFDLASLNAALDGDPTASQFPGAQALLTKGNCSACHLVEGKRVGPSFSEIADKYRSQEDALDFLATKIIEGGAGSWGQVAMPPNVLISENDARSILRYVMSLGDPDAERVPITGDYTPVVASDPGGNESILMRASYRDRGEELAPELTARALRVLRSPKLRVADADALLGIEVSRFGATVSQGGSLAFRDIDLTGIKQLKLSAFVSERFEHRGGIVEVRLGSLKGELVGKGEIRQAQGGGDRTGKRRPQQAATANVDVDSEAPRPQRNRGRGRFNRPTSDIAIDAISSRADLYLVFANPEAGPEDRLLVLSEIAFSLEAPSQ